MATARSQSGFLFRYRDGFLFARDRRRGFEGDAENNRFAIADSALHAAGTVRRRADSVLTNLKRIVVLRAFHGDGREAGTYLKAFCGREAEHGFGEICVEPVKNRLAQTWRQAADDALDDSA